MTVLWDRFVYQEKVVTSAIIRIPFLHSVDGSWVVKIIRRNGPIIRQSRRKGTGGFGNFEAQSTVSVFSGWLEFRVGASLVIIQKVSA
jgi:hypothetical protein